MPASGCQGVQARERGAVSEVRDTRTGAATAVPKAVCPAPGEARAASQAHLTRHVPPQTWRPGQPLLSLHSPVPKGLSGTKLFLPAGSGAWMSFQSPSRLRVGTASRSTSFRAQTQTRPPCVPGTRPRVQGRRRPTSTPSPAVSRPVCTRDRPRETGQAASKLGHGVCLGGSRQGRTPWAEGPGQVPEVTLAGRT